MFNDLFQRQRAGLRLTICGLLLTTAAHADAEVALNDPGCMALTGWSQDLDRAATVHPVPGITVNARFADPLVEALFGVPFMDWQNDDTTALQGWLTGCRSEAMKQGDKDAGNALYAMVKETRNAYKQLRGVWSAERMVHNSVERLGQLKPDPDSAKVMEIGVAALRGEDVSAAVQALPPRWTGYGRQAAQMGEQAALLPEKRRAAFIATLQEASSGAVAAVAEQSAAQEALLGRIAAVPNTQAGLDELYAIARQVDPGTMTGDDFRAYGSAFQARRSQVQNALQAQADAEEARRRSLPATVVARIDALLDGDGVDELEFRDLPLNATRGRLTQVPETRWGLKQAPTFSLDEVEYTVTVSQLSSLVESERRSGPAVGLRTHEGRVGRIRYAEHFPGPVPVAELKAHLVARLGQPDKRAGNPGFVVLDWEDGDRLLEVSAGGRIQQHMQNRGVQSSMTLVLSDRGFVSYLQEAGEHCEKLADKPRNALSQSEAIQLGMGCLEP